MDPHEYYAQHSPLTDPGAHADLFEGLPAGIEDLCRVVQGLIVPHGDSKKLFGYEVPKSRLPEADSLYVERMLARIRELDGRPLTEERPLDRRLVGCCRDLAVLLCALLRHRELPARVRYGFASYFIPGFNADQVVVEYWDGEEDAWRFVDPELSPVHLRAYRIPFGPCEVPREQFIPGGLAWRACRAGRADPDRFGLDPKIGVYGWWFIRGRLILDLLALNKRELLPWHSWGLMAIDAQPTARELALLDRVAALALAGDEAFDELRAVYESEPELKLPPVIMNFSPAGWHTDVLALPRV